MASPRRGQEPEPHVVAERLERMSGLVVVEAEEEVRVAPLAEPRMAETRVALMVDEEGEALAVGVLMSMNKRRRVDESVESDDGDGISGVVEIPVEQRREPPTGPRVERIGGIRRGNGVPVDLFVRRAYRFADRSLVGESNGMVGNSYHTRECSAHAQRGGNMRGGYMGRGFRPYG